MTSCMLHGVVAEIVREHVQLAAFQWTQHKVLSGGHPLNEAAVADIGGRLIANLDAIEIAGNAAWQFIMDQFEDFPEAGELFVAGYISIIKDDRKRSDHCLALAHQHPGSRAGFVGALSWFPPTVSGPIVRRMIESSSDVHRASGIDVLTQHNADPGERMARFLADPSPMVRASACALAAAADRRDCGDLICGLTEVDDADLRFAAAAALGSLGRAEAAASPLKAEVESGGDRAEAALRLLSRTLSDADFRAYLGLLHRRDDTRPLAVRGIGMTGDSAH